jgi:hypothetical protein
VTTPDDIDTINLCKFYHVEHITTLSFYEKNQTFGKSEGINVALNKLKEENYDGWVCHLDSDIVLAPRTMDFVREAILNTPDAEKCIFGIDRFKVVGFENWVNFITKPNVLYEQEVWLRTDLFPVFPRIFKCTWLPIGYFQLWHSSVTMAYPTVHENAARADMLFSLKFPRKHRQFIPEAVAFHLESELCSMGANWNGRTTKPFRIDPPSLPQYDMPNKKNYLQKVQNFFAKNLF